MHQFPSMRLFRQGIIFQRKGIEIAELDPMRDVDWEESIKNVESAPCIAVHALYILYRQELRVIYHLHSLSIVESSLFTIEKKE
ncbi:hypothetical protein JTB14_016793 [Gonioctena quinquepunctata]|nr:hypothetical protein JTB14_016793 [Gonioctena quinquepunctata]